MSENTENKESKEEEVVVPSASNKDNNPKTNKVKSNKVKAKKKKKVALYSCQGYCNLTGANNAMRFVSKMKFKGEGKRSEKDWEKMFKEHNLI